MIGTAISWELNNLESQINFESIHQATLRVLSEVGILLSHMEVKELLLDAGADFLTSHRIADPNKIAITGRSWGGYLTMTCLTQYPERWRAGSAVVPFLNWFTGHANSREDLQHWDLENFGDPEKDQELWYERSPFFFLERIQAPVQLICGAHDVRCPESESTRANEQLTNLGKVCEYILYPDEGHSFLKVENQVKSKQQQVDFLEKHLELDNT